MKSNSIKYVSAIVLGMFAVSVHAFEPILYESRTDYGRYSEYNGTRLGGWNVPSSGAQSNQRIYSAGIYRCPTNNAQPSCAVSHEAGDQVAWAVAVAVAYKQAIIPTVNDFTITGTVTRTGTHTEADRTGADVRKGYYSKFIRYMPRKPGNVTMYGVRVKAGYRDVPRCGVCVQTNRYYAYYDDPNRVATVIEGNKNLRSSHIATYLIGATEGSVS